MKTRLTLALLMLFSVSVGKAELTPSDPKTPLFQIYEAAFLPDTGPDPRTHKAKLGKLLLSVFTLRDFQSLPDNAVRVTLNAQDAETFSQITHTHDYLLCVTGDEKAGVTMHMTGPIDDGVITFTASNYGLDVARYLRRRYAKSPNHAMERTAGSVGS